MTFQVSENFHSRDKNFLAFGFRKSLIEKVSWDMSVVLADVFIFSCQRKSSLSKTNEVFKQNKNFMNWRQFLAATREIEIEIKIKILPWQNASVFIIYFYFFTYFYVCFCFSLLLQKRSNRIHVAKELLLKNFIIETQVFFNV